MSIYFNSDEAVKKIVVIALLSGADDKILEKSPGYLLEKYDAVVLSSLPESLLDNTKREILERYLKRWSN